MEYVTGGDLPPLLWHPPGPAGTGYQPKRFASPGNPSEELSCPKPSGGLWTSAAVENRGKPSSVWQSWCLRNGWRVADLSPGVPVHPHYRARVLVIDSLADAVEAHQEWPGRGRFESEPWWAQIPVFQQRRYLNWETMPASVDAVCLTASGVSQLNNGFTSFALWDVPTVYWLNPAYTIAEAGRPGKSPRHRREYSMTASTAPVSPVKGSALTKGTVVILAYEGDQLVASGSARPRSGGTYLITEDPYPHRAHKRNPDTGRGSSIPVVRLTVRPIAPNHPHSIGPDETVTIPARKTVLTTDILTHTPGGETP